jgi:hypothetical protein
MNEKHHTTSLVQTSTFFNEWFKIFPTAEIPEGRFDSFSKGVYHPGELAILMVPSNKVISQWKAGIWYRVSCVAGSRSPVTNIPPSPDKHQEWFNIYQHLSKPTHSIAMLTRGRHWTNSPSLVQGEIINVSFKNPYGKVFEVCFIAVPLHRFSKELLMAGLMHVFRGLEYLHTKCRIVHTVRTSIWYNHHFADT